MVRIGESGRVIKSKRKKYKPRKKTTGRVRVRKYHVDKFIRKKDKRQKKKYPLAARINGYNVKAHTRKRPKKRKK